ncbi:MAG: DUF599 family protein [Rhizobiaceae bacterium]|nr:DUF599 family protein [Rhizobiaceae bacterium]
MSESLPLTIADLAALAFFLAVWTLHTLAAEGFLVSRVSLSSAMNIQRVAWMRTMARRELRMVDTGIMTGLQQGTAFFASTSLVALGGCLAMLRASGETLAVLTDLPLVASTSRGLVEIKLLGLACVLAYAFFKFGWSYRLFNYCSILIGAVPTARDELSVPNELEVAVHRATRMNILAGRHFNAGMRAIFFSIGYLGWFVGAAAFVLATLLILAVLVRRQFFSAARRAALDEPVDGLP